MSWNKLQLALVLLLAAAPQVAADALSRHPSGSSSSDTSDDANGRHPTSSASSGDSSHDSPAASTSESEPSAASRHPSGSASSGESRGPAEGGDDRAHRTHRQHNDEGRDAVVDADVSAEQSASDSGPTAPRPKRSFWVVGVGAAPLGGSLGWMHYETEQLRYGVLWQLIDEESSYAGGEVAWAPGRGDVSPYVSVGVGMITTSDAEDDVSAAAKLEAGVEILHRDNVRALIGANTILRLGEHGDLVNTSLHVRVCF